MNNKKMSNAEKFNKWVSERMGHPLGACFGINAVNELTEEKEAFDNIDVKLIKPREPSKPVVTKIEWCGAGLPPVGVECEYAFSGGDYSDWFECEILYVGKQCVFIKTKDENLIKSFGCEELSVEICNTKFRKPETPQQREARERLEAAYDLYVECGGYSDPFSFKQFCKPGTVASQYLAIVDKTNYRVEGE